MLRQSFESKYDDGYYIVPLTFLTGKRTNPQIDFEKVQQVLRYNKVAVQISNMDELEEGDSIITPLHRPKERFIIEKVCRSLNPWSAFPEPSKARTYEEYFRRQYPSMKTTTERNQPLILVRSMPQRVNFLVDRKKIKSKEKLKKDMHFIPELCSLRPFSARLLLKASELPSILYRMTSLLLVMEMRVFIVEGCGLEAKKAVSNETEKDLPAIRAETVVINKASSSAMVDNPSSRGLFDYASSSPSRDRYNKEFSKVSRNLAKLFSNNQSNFLHPDSALLLQALTTKGAGDAFDLERLEMLGDAFLKQAVSIYLFCFYTNKDEGKLTRRKVRQISNLKLYKVSKAHNLPGYMQTTVLDRKTWAPPCLQVKKTNTPQELVVSKNAKRQKLDSDSKQEDFTRQTISDKSVADSIEALIGAYLVSGGYKGALYFLDYLGIKVSNT
jgi:endoribonuclease Dicer